ncbi:HlyD family secretion protein [Methylocapsa polymorpha]|uniref:HlyD family secretion protein n=1 Tax=Methylocapsa polymorpha TaxID=3080828 RepID=A0ABZ0HZ96_9HYPH|nr:HlyD family secretion protein [Methylocapsa sp. RX1]
MDPSASSLSRPISPSRENDSVISGEAVLRLRRDAPLIPSSEKNDTAGLAGKAPLKRFLRRRGFFVLALLLALGAGGRFGWHWWTDGRFEETTDNAFLQADKVVVAPKVGGFVSEVFVADNQPVKAGQVLARIDERDYRVALLQSQADLDKSRASLEGVASALIQQQAKIEEAKADVATVTAALDFATEEQTRYGSLLQKGAGTVQRSHQATSDLLQKQAALDKAKAAYDAAQKQTEGLRSLEAAARASLQRSEINLEQAKLNLEYTTIIAPIDGVVGDRSLRKGQLVQPGSNLLTLVPMGDAIYLIANFKETQVGAMAEGQAVTFIVDAFGDHVFHGRIDSFAPGTGAQFALLPPENATGNFTKIVQRVPVKIVLGDGDPLIQRLRPGLSAEAMVDTRDQGEPSPSKTIMLGALKAEDARR